MRSKILWKAKRSQKNISNLFRYEKFVFSKYKFKVTKKAKAAISNGTIRKIFLYFNNTK